MEEQQREIIKHLDIESGSRYNFIASIAKDYLVGTGLVEDRPSSPEDLARVETLLIRSAEASHDLVGPGLWDHFILCEIYGEEISERYPKLGFNRYEMGALALLHHLGGIIEPATITRNSILTRAILKKARVKDAFIEIAIPTLLIQAVGKYISGMEDLTPAQRIIDIIENLGKTTPDGRVFTMEILRQHLDGLIKNPPQKPSHSTWPSEARGQINMWEKGRQEFAIKLLFEEIQWAKDMGIDFEILQKAVEQKYNQPKRQAFLFALENAQKNKTPK